MNESSRLTPRERQVMKIVTTRSDGSTAAEIREAMDDPPSYSAVRALLKVMEEKELLTHRQDGPRYVYEPIAPRRKLRRSALKEVLSGFFGGSKAALVETLFDPADGALTPEEAEQLKGLIEKAKEKGMQRDA